MKKRVRHASESTRAFLKVSIVAGRLPGGCAREGQDGEQRGRGVPGGGGSRMQVEHGNGRGETIYHDRRPCRLSGHRIVFARSGKVDLPLSSHPGQLAVSGEAQGRRCKGEVQLARNSTDVDMHRKKERTTVMGGQEAERPSLLAGRGMLGAEMLRVFLNGDGNLLQRRDASSFKKNGPR